MLQRVLIIWILTAVSPWVSAQRIVKGIVRDLNDSPVPFCNVYLQHNGLPFHLTHTDEAGAYQLEQEGADSCELIVTAVGFKRHAETIAPRGAVLVADVILFPDTVMLDQVIVYGESPVQSRGDTVLYDASYFLSGNDIVLADLLKRLPGLSVDEEGKVKFQGKEVQRIKVEDDDLFGSNYSLLTKNLSADLVEQVQVLQNYSDNPLLKNIEDSDEVALNLVLNKDRRKILFGDIQAGSNFADRHEARANLVSFLDKGKVYALGNFNNVGADPTGDVEELQRSGQASHVVGDDVGSEFVVPVIKPYLSEFRRDRYYFNQASFGSLNAIYKPAKKLSIKLLGYLYQDQPTFALAQATDYFTSTDTIAFRELAASAYKERISDFRGTLLFQFSPQAQLTYNGRINYSDGQVRQRSNLNQRAIDKTLDFSGLLYDHHINITRKFSDKEALTIDVRYLSDARPQQFVSKGNLVGGYFPWSPPADSLFQGNDMPTEFYGGELNYLQRLSSAKLGVRAGYKQLVQALNTELRSAVSYYSLAQNQLERRDQEGYGEIYYAWNKNNITITPTVSFQHLMVNLTDRATLPLNFVNPRLGFRWKFSPHSHLSALYSRGNHTSSAVQLMRNPWLKDYNLLAINDNGFRAFARTTYLVNYQLGDWTSRFSLLATIYHQEFPNDYLGNVDVESNYTVVTTNQLADRKLSSMSIMLDRFFKSILTNLKIDWRTSRAEFVTSTEGVRVPTISTGNTVDISLRSAFRRGVNAHLGHILQVSQSSSNLVEASNYTSQFYVDGYFTTFQERLHLTLHLERYELMSIAGRPTFYFMDLRARLRLRKDKRLLLFLNARNLLDETAYAQRTLSPQSVGTVVNPLIPRYILLGLELKW